MVKIDGVDSIPIDGDDRLIVMLREREREKKNKKKIGGKERITCISKGHQIKHKQKKNR